jgi:hypothetical protein
MSREKTFRIFRELAGDRADRLAPTHYPADVNDRITDALIEDATRAPGEEAIRRDGIGFHLVDWNGDAAFLVALILFPERFSDEEIRDGVENLLIHVPAHVMEAARLGGYRTENFFAKESDDE